MKKTLLYITLLLLFSISINAQQRNKDRIKLLKASYITDALDLTQSEAEKFWPVYNLYTDKIVKAKFDLESIGYRKIKNSGGIDNISEEEAKEFIANSIATEKEISTNKIKMTEELSKIISAKKIMKLQKAERDFNRQMIKEYGKRRRMQGN